MGEPRESLCDNLDEIWSDIGDNRLMVCGAVEVVEVEMISRGVYCNCIWAFSSDPNNKARVTWTTHGNAARKDWEMWKLTMERWVILRSGVEEEWSNGVRMRY